MLLFEQQLLATKVTKRTKIIYKKLRVLRDLRGLFFALPILIVFFCHTVFAQTAAQFQGEKIVRVDVGVEGAFEKQEREQLLEFINIRPGEDYSIAKIREAIYGLYDTGRASNVKVEASQKIGGVELVFSIKRQQRVGKVIFSGIPIFAEIDLLLRLVNLDQGVKLTQPAVERSAENLVEFYNEAGYFQAVVTPAIKSDPNMSSAVVDFTVLPGIQARVKNIELLGAVKIDRDAAIAEMKTRPGEFFAQSLLQADIEMFRMRHINAGYLAPRIDSPEIVYDGEANDVSVKLTAASGPKVEVEVKGFEITRKKLRKTLPILTQGGTDEFAVEESRRRLFEAVQLQGYFFADITFQIERPDEENLKIVYAVDQGQRYRVDRARITGTEEFRYAEISSELKTKEASALSRGITSADFLDADAAKIETKLRDLGYSQAKVRERRLSVSTDLEGLTIVFVVEEGPRVMVEDVLFEGNRVFSSEELLVRLPKRKISYLSRIRVNEDVDKLLSYYNSFGYSEADVKPVVETLEDTRARVTFRIAEGDQVIVNNIIVNNNGKSSAAAIRRFISLREGRLLNREEMNKSEQRLYATGAFRTASVRSEYVSRNNDGRVLHDVIADVVEAQPYTLIYGFGYQSEDGPRGQFQITDANFFSRLQTASLTLRASRREQLGQISYQFPQPFGFNINPIAVFSYRRRREVSFNSRRLTALFQIDRQLTDASDLILRYTFEDVNVFDQRTRSDRPDLDRDEQTIRLGRVSGTYIRDTRDDVFDASKGTFLSADLSLAAGPFGSERDFARMFANYQQYYKLLERPRVLFASNLQLGLSKTFDSRRRLPLSERFFAGGANTLRGFEFERAGPRNAVSGQPIGGNALIVINSELRFPLTTSIGGVLFHDTGNVFRTVSDVRIRDFSNTLGIGVRVATPVGPIRLDVGYLINPRTPERRVQFHFSIGQAF